jgi:glycosyltransferase involved in cell wall biosynthesis
MPADIPAPYRMIYRAANRKASAIVCVSDHVRSTFEEAFPRSARIMRTIRNGVDTSRFAAPVDRRGCRELFGLPRDAVVIGTVGRLVPVKNHALLIEAFSRISARFPEIRLAILGQGKSRDSLASLAAGEGLEGRISIHQTVSDVAKFYGALDIFALSSDSEGLPLTLLEAMASGLPVAATSVGGIPEAVEDGASGLLVPPGDAGNLAAALATLLENPDLASSMGQRGRIAAMERFDAGDCISGYEDCYAEVLARTA